MPLKKINNHKKKKQCVFLFLNRTMIRNTLHRFANKNDCGKILDFIKQLAEYEKMSDEVVATEELLQEWIFEKQKAEVIFALENEKEVGFALFFHNFSTFLGRAGIYLEDLFVLPQYRGKGYGKGLLKQLAKIAVERKSLTVPSSATTVTEVISFCTGFPVVASKI